jgi:hypothetical protein
MSNNAALTRLATPISRFIIKRDIEFLVEGATIGVYSTTITLPKNHSVLNVDVYTKTALIGAGATISIGYDDPTTEPDNMLNDEAVASFATAGLLVAGIQRAGTAATKTEVGTADIVVAYEIKTANLTAGVITLLIECLPTA